MNEVRMPEPEERLHEPAVPIGPLLSRVYAVLPRMSDADLDLLRNRLIPAVQRNRHGGSAWITEEQAKKLEGAES